MSPRESLQETSPGRPSTQAGILHLPSLATHTLRLGLRTNKCMLAAARQQWPQVWLTNPTLKFAPMSEGKRALLLSLGTHEGSRAIRTSGL